MRVTLPTTLQVVVLHIFCDRNGLVLPPMAWTSSPAFLFSLFSALTDPFPVWLRMPRKSIDVVCRERRRTHPPERCMFMTAGDESHCVNASPLRVDAGAGIAMSEHREPGHLAPGWIDLRIVMEKK